MAGWPEIYDEVFGRIKGLKQSGESWLAYCPSHEDTKTRSLALRVLDGKLVLKCHANHGCATERIMDAIGLPMTYLFADGRRGAETVKKHRHIVATYPYKGDDGNVVFEVVRYDPKEFRQRRPNPDYDEMKASTEGNQPFLWHTKGINRVLYHQDVLVKALGANQHQVVFVAEGEKAADALMAIGVLGTCSSGGAGKWSMTAVEASRVLAGKRVVILADDDPADPESGAEPGMDHARDVARHLEPVAARVKILRLSSKRDKSDVWDWIEERKRHGQDVAEIRAELMELARDAYDCVSIDSVHPWIRQGIVEAKIAWEAAGDQSMLEFFGELRLAWVGLELKAMAMAEAGRFDADVRPHIERVVSVISRMCRANGGKIVEKSIPI